MNPPSCVIDRVTHESSQLTFAPAISFATLHLLIAYISGEADSGCRHLSVSEFEFFLNFGLNPSAPEFLIISTESHAT